jgi:hypothetical protein
MALYTIIFEYRGGSYTRQVKASSEAVAFQVWAKEIVPEEIMYFGHKMKATIIKDSFDPDYSPVLLKGLDNVWCATWSGSGLIQIVKTAKK